MTKVTANEHGVRWARSRNGRISIAVATTPSRAGEFAVWGLYVGTHDLAPIARSFPEYEQACAYANEVWARR